MTKLSFIAAFAIGLAIPAWIGLGFVGASWIPLVVTAAILAVYLLGAFELRQFRAGTLALQSALDTLAAAPASLGEWLEKLPASLRNAVRTRIEGERAGLPGPALTPYLVGLLVMLGMLGTFLGMVVTFKGAVFALEGSTDLQAIRAALAEPIKGLGLSFGTSVAGVAASAMLGLMSAISRRERLDSARELDARIAGVLRPFSLVQQRQETYRALQQQTQSLPQVVAALQALMERIEHRSEQLDQQLLQRQAQFQGEVTRAYTGLAESVGTALKDSLAASAKSAGDTIRPVVEGAMAQVAQESRRMQERLGEVAQAQVAALTQQFSANARSAADTWTQALQKMAADLQAQWQGIAGETLAQQREAGDTAANLLQRSEELVRARTETEARWTAQQGERMEQLATLWRTELAALREDEGRRGDAAVARLGELETAVAQHLATLGAALEAPITRLLHTASEVPQAAAGVITRLREEMSRLSERDNLALEERTALLERLGALLQTVNAASSEQRAAIDALVNQASSVLEQTGARFAETLQAQTGQAADTAAHAAASAVELASVAEAFGQGVQLFQVSNDKLVETLTRVEASLQKSTARSDEQLAYYVAQAREVIDLSIASQQGLVDNLRQLQVQP